MLILAHTSIQARTDEPTEIGIWIILWHLFNNKDLQRSTQSTQSYHTATDFYRITPLVYPNGWYLVLDAFRLFCVSVWLRWECGLTSASVALWGEGGSSRGEGVSCGRVHHAGVEGWVRVGPEGRWERQSVRGRRETEREREVQVKLNLSLFLLLTRDI